MPKNYSCMEVCGMAKHCGNKYCSNHPKYVPPAPKKRKKKEQDTASTSARRRVGFFKGYPIVTDTSASMSSRW